MRIHCMQPCNMAPQRPRAGFFCAASARHERALAPSPSALARLVAPKSRTACRFARAQQKNKMNENNNRKKPHNFDNNANNDSTRQCHMSAPPTHHSWDQGADGQVPQAARRPTGADAAGAAGAAGAPAALRASIHPPRPPRAQPLGTALLACTGELATIAARA